MDRAALCKAVLFSLDRRDCSGRPKQPPVGEQIDTIEICHFQILHAAPRSMTENQFAFAMAVNNLRECVVTGISDASNRWLDASLRRTLSPSYGQILPAVIATMYVQLGSQNLQHEP